MVKSFWKKLKNKKGPIVAQVFGAKPENFYQSAKLIKKLGFDGIDINLGCPDKKVLKQGAGAALIKNPKLAREIIRQTKKGAGKLPVSIKTRIGYDKYDKKEFKKWLTVLLEEKPAAITIHGRTKKEMSLVPAHWDAIAEAIKIRNEFDDSKDRTLILGNGDVKSLADAEEKARISGADGVMIGRAVLGNPWLFAEKEKVASFATPCGARRREQSNPPPGGYASRANDAAFSQTIKFQILLEHVKLFEKINKGQRFDMMKKHFKAYVSGFNGAKELRIKLMNCQNAKEVKEIILASL